MALNSVLESQNVTYHNDVEMSMVRARGDDTVFFIKRVSTIYERTWSSTGM